MVAIKYVKDVGRFSYESSKGYSEEGIDLRSTEYFRRLHECGFDLPTPSARNDLYVSRHQPYTRNEQNQLYDFRQRFSRHSSSCQYQ